MAIEPGLWEGDERRRKRRNMIAAAIGIAFSGALTGTLLLMTGG
jgi:hypothetical protein